MLLPFKSNVHTFKTYSSPLFNEKYKIENVFAKHLKLLRTHL